MTNIPEDQFIPPEVPTTFNKEAEKRAALYSVLRRALGVFQLEHDVSWSEIIGTLEQLKLDMYQLQLTQFTIEDEEDEEDDDN